MSELRLPALRTRQGANRHIYQFAVDGRSLAGFATVSRVHRDAGNTVAGYQRPEALAHIAAIRRYLQSENPLMPNALVIAFDGRVRFEMAPAAGGHATEVGTLVIPVVAAGEPVPGLIVDGQQRSAALRDADLADFPVPVVAFITDDVAEQRAQFVLVNNQKPLPKGLIHELLPGTDAPLPVALARKRFPAALLDKLNFTDVSPLYGLIRTPTAGGGVIRDNSMLRALTQGLSDGALYAYRDPMTGAGDVNAMLQLLYAFWGAVRETFPHAWGRAPRHSRLMHGVGVLAVSTLMDDITERHRLAGRGEPDMGDYFDELAVIADSCAWTSGHWPFGRAWNELQNTGADTRLLTDWLCGEYRRRARAPSSAA